MAGTMRMLFEDTGVIREVSIKSYRPMGRDLRGDGGVVERAPRAPIPDLPPGYVAIAPGLDHPDYDAIARRI